jgi:hypothetical protein
MPQSVYSSVPLLVGLGSATVLVGDALRLRIAQQDRGAGSGETAKTFPSMVPGVAQIRRGAR